MTSLGDWLKDQGLEKYLTVFEEENITLELLPKLQPDDLREMGLSIGHRRVFLDAVSTQSAGSGFDNELEYRLIGAERRQLTVMFVDLTGSTTLSEQMDPEEMADLLRLYNGVVEQQIEEYGGHIARYMGDGVLVYFGWPKAKEDDAHRSVLAGLAITSEVSNIIDNAGQSLQARVGIDTGLVVVGEVIGHGISQEEAVVGEAPNRAARLQALACPGQVVIGPNTKSRLGNSFELNSLKPQTLKGIKHQVEPWRVIRSRTNINRFQARSGTRITPLVGRKKELDAFITAIERKQFHGFFLSGEAGVGKSRLIHEIDQFYKDSVVYKLHYQCSPNHSNTFMHPVVEQLTHDLQIEQSARPLSTIINNWYVPCENSDDHISVLASLLDVTIDTTSTQITQSPQRQRSRTLEIIVENCCARSRSQPCLVIFEDLQWADSSTLELINKFIETSHSANIILAANYRPEFNQRPWTKALVNSQNCTFINLEPLADDSAFALLSKLADGIPIHQSIVRQIVEQSDGIPLYLEEVLRSFLGNHRPDHVLNAETYDSGHDSVPTTLHDALMERLDSLNYARHIAQVGALIGREFRANLIQTVSNIDKKLLSAGLKELMDAGIVVLRDTVPVHDSDVEIDTDNTDAETDNTYVFRHALIQQSAYDSLLLNNRKKLHLALANYLYQEDDQTAAPNMENIARHYSMAECFDLAARCWLQAAERLYAKAAMADALSCAQQGLQALNNYQGNASGCKEDALGLHFIHGHAAVHAFGGASRDAEKSFELAQSISESMGNTQQIFTVNFGLFYHHWQRAETKKALPIALKMQSMSKKIKTPVASLVADSVFGAISFHSGDVVEADECLSRSFQSYTPGMHTELVRDYGFNMGLFSGVYFALSRMGRGHLLTANIQLLDCIEHANEVNHSPSTCYTIAVGLSLRLMLRQPAASIVKHCDACIELALSQDLPLWATFAEIIKGSALSRAGQHEQGIQLIESGIAAGVDTGAKITNTWWYSLSSDAYLAINDTERALTEANTAIDSAKNTQENQFLSECLISKGKALAALGEHMLAIDAYSAAITSSKKHRNLYAELRSSLALAELYIQKNDNQTAIQVLESVYNTFPEISDNHYLQKAKAILSRTPVENTFL